MDQLDIVLTKHAERSPNAMPLLCVEHLSVRLGHRLVLNDICFNLYAGERMRISGSNGSGKTTLLNAIMGIVNTDRGRILFRNQDITNTPTHLRARLGIGYMRQRDNVFPSLTVGDNLHLGIGPGAYEIFASAFPEWTEDLGHDVLVGKLSGGLRQRLAWAALVLSKSQLLLADEASAGVSGSLNLPSEKLLRSLISVEHT